MKKTKPSSEEKSAQKNSEVNNRKGTSSSGYDNLQRENKELLEELNAYKKAEREIKNWKQRFEIIAESSGEVIYDYDIRSGNIEWSGTLEKVFGYKLNEMNGGVKQWVKLIHKDDRKEALRRLEIAEKNRTPFNFEYRFKHKNGIYLDIKDNGFIMESESGSGDRIIGTMQDITSQKRSMELMKALNTAVLEMQKVHTKEKVFKAVANELKKMEIECSVLRVDRETDIMRFEYYSYDSVKLKVIQKIAGMTIEEYEMSIKGLNEFEDVIKNKKTVIIEKSDDFLKRALPLRLKFLSGPLLKVFDLSKIIVAPLIIENNSIGVFLVQSNGLIESDIPEVTMFAHQLAGVWKKSELYENAQREILERQKVVKALKLSEERFSKAFLSSPYAISISHLESGRYIDVNDSFLKLVGYSKNEVVGRSSLELDLWIDKKERKNVTEELNTKGSIKNIETNFKNRMGQIQTWKSSLEIIELNGEKCILSLIENVTEQKNAIRELKESEERFFKAFTLSPYIVSISNFENGNYLEVNDNFVKFSGLKREDIVGKNALELDFYVDKNFRGWMYEELRKQGSIKEAETKVRLKSGEIKTVRMSAELMVLKGENCLLAMVEDITEKKKAEDTIKENTRIINTLINNLPGVVYRCLNDNNWTMEYISEEIFRMTGYPASDFINNRVRSFASIIVEEDREQIREEIQKGLKDNIQYTLEYNIKTADGKIKSVWEKGIGIFENGVLVALEGYIADITDRKKAEAENILLAHTVRSVQDAISLTDMNNNLIYINDAFLEMYGYSEDEIIGKSINMLSPVGSESISDYIHSETLKNGWHGEITNVKKDGTEFPLELWTSVVRDSKNNILATVGIAKDVSERKKSEIALMESEERFRGIFENSPIGMIQSTIDGSIINVNFCLAKMLGYDSVEEFISIIKKKGMRDALSINQEKRDKIINGVKNSTKWESIEMDFKRKDGSFMTGGVVFRAFTNRLNGKTELEGLITDITERKRAQKEIDEANKKFLQAQRVAKIGSWEVNLVTNEIVWSDEMFEIFEIEKTDNLELESLLKLIPSVNVEHYMDAFKESVISNKPYSNDYKIKISDDRIKFIHDEGEVIYDDEGKAVRMFGTTQDITERMQAYEELNKSERRFSLFFSQSLDGYYYTQLDEPIEWNSKTDKEKVLDYARSNQKIVEMNNAMLKQYGARREDLINKPVSIFFEHETEYGRNLTKKLFDEGRLHVETNERKIDGTPIWIEGDYVCLYDERGRITGTFGIQRDITDRKKTELDLIEAKEKAEEMNRVKSSFLANMSHEVRTPLVAILGFSEVLSEIVKEENILNYVEMIHAGGKRLLDTLNLILDLSVIESQKIKFDLKTVDIIKEAEDIVALFGKYAEKKKLSLTIETIYDTLEFKTDEKILRQVLNNLVNNAIKYTDNGGVTVRVLKEVKNEKQYIALKIEDTGIGIPEDKKELIWDEFRQVSEGISRSFEGAGLGLSITKKFVEKMGCEIYLEKSEIDVGSIFTVLFPVEEKIFRRAKVKYDMIKDKTEEYGSSLPKLLYIDDDSMCLDIVKAFTTGKYIVDFACTGKEGIEKAESNIYNAILMDINLGTEMNGIEATKIIREIAGYKEIPIIAITAFAMVGDKEEFFACGCSHYLSKPFDKKDLLDLLREVFP